MRAPDFQSKWFRMRACIGLGALLWIGNFNQSHAATAPPPPPLVLTVEGTNVWVQRFRSNAWESAYPKQILRDRDRGRTGLRSRTTVRLTDLSVLRIGERSEFEIQPLPESQTEASFSLFRGILYLLHRDRPGSHRFNTPTATAATRGTEFTLEYEEATGRTILTVLEGEAELSNAAGAVQLASGEQGVAVLGQVPTRTAVLDTINIIQWCLYYPAVLDLDELGLTPAEAAPYSESIGAYRQGDLLQAVAMYPVARIPASDRERIYVAALLLAVGQVSETESLLNSLTGTDADSVLLPRLAGALRRVIAAVKLRAPPGPPASLGIQPLATELLAESYALQSQYQLLPALESARAATRVSPQFGFGWARVAELEFSRGNSQAALRSLQRSLSLSPRNAQALALKGFVLTAQNRIGDALGYFEQAIQVDGGLGNAWLGRGLCRIRQGETEAGRKDLQVAAAMEPQRGVLRSYLGKAFSNTGNNTRAQAELNLAKHLDEKDPTAWLYSALLLQQKNQINLAVDDLERSLELNDNRRVFRSRLLLDQDRAVRSANLATIYRDAGLTDLSVREASRAVNLDYANYSAHLFLANSYNQLRDPKQINLRYETAWFNEYLLANLLAPVGAGTLSQTVSQQEYSKLFERDRSGISSSTEYFSHGEWFQSAAQYGTFQNTSYAAEVFHHSDTGYRSNNDLYQLATVLNLKQQFSARDSVYIRANYYESEYGDVNQYYDERSANPGLRTRERYDPSILAGYHHEWSPGQHTLGLVGRLQNRYEATNPQQGTLFVNRLFGPITAVAPLFYEQEYQNDLELYTAELQHLAVIGSHLLVFGGRFQSGEFETRNQQSNGRLFNGSRVALDVTQKINLDIQRETVYAYDQWQVAPALLLVGGLSYDRVQFPENYRYAPMSNFEVTREQLSPKAGFILTPATGTILRFAYARGLGGISLDQSVRLEPSQVAGFNQAYRSLIPESVAGANAAPEFETWSMSLEQKIGRRTFIGVSAELLTSDVDRTVGVVEFSPPTAPGTALATSSTRERIEFQERSLNVTLNHLLAEEWSIGASYRLSLAELQDDFGDIPISAQAGGNFRPRQDLESLVHRLDLALIYNHPSGFFGRGSATWISQTNRRYAPEQPGDSFAQLNLETGWRFWRRRAELRVGVLNLTDQNYRLNPLNLMTELPRGRTFTAGLQFNF